MIEYPPLWTKGTDRLQFGFGKSMMFPNIPWGEKGTKILVPTIPDFVSKFDDPVEEPVLLVGNTPVSMDHSHKTVLSRFGHFKALFDEQMQCPPAEVNETKAVVDVMSTMLAWTKGVTIDQTGVKLPLPRAVTKSVKFSLCAAGKRLLLATLSVKNKHTVFLWDSDTKANWTKTNIELQGGHSIAVSDDMSVVATYCGDEVSCWEYKDGELVPKWKLKGEPDPMFEKHNNFAIAVSDEFVIFERPKSSLQTHSVKDGSYVCGALSMPTISSLAVQSRFLLIGGISNTYQRFTLHNDHWIPDFFRYALDFKTESKSLRLPVEYFWISKVRGSKVVLVASSFLLALVLDETRPVHRLFKGVFISAEILGDYLLTLERAAEGRFVFSMCNFIQGDVLQTFEIKPKRAEVESDRSFIFASATRIKIAMFDSRVYQVNSPSKPLTYTKIHDADSPSKT